MPTAPTLTIGIEEEFQLIDPVTRDLKSHILQILEENKTILAERVKPEIHQSVAEVGTGICKTIQDAEREVIGLRRFLRELKAPMTRLVWVIPVPPSAPHWAWPLPPNILAVIDALWPSLVMGLSPQAWPLKP